MEMVDNLVKYARTNIVIPSQQFIRKTKNILHQPWEKLFQPLTTTVLLVDFESVLTFFQPKLSLAKCRRNVENFLEACKQIGVKDVSILTKLTNIFHISHKNEIQTRDLRD